MGELDSRSALGGRRAVWAVLLTGCAVIVALGWALAWEPVDDAYISFRYARHAAAGDGWVFNPGERVEGYTNFLWTVMLAGAARVGWAIPTASVWLGVICVALSCGLTFALARHVAVERGRRPVMAYGSVLLLLVYPGFSYWAFAGMEGPLLTCLVTGFLLMAGRRWLTWPQLLLTALLGAGAALTRWEAVLLWPVAVLARLIGAEGNRRERFQRAGGLSALLILLFGGYYLWRLNYYGDPLPNTFYAKMGGALLPRIMGGIRYSGELGVNWLLPASLPVWLLGKRGRWTLLLASALLVQIAYVTWTGGDHFPWLRFYLPVLPIAAILLSDTVAAAGARLGRFTAGGAVLIAAWVACIGAWIDYGNAVSHRRWVHDWFRVGQWVREEIPVDHCVAMAPVGVVPWVAADHVFIDMLGLTDRDIAHHGVYDPADPVGHRRSGPESLLKRKPEVVLGQAVLMRSEPTIKSASTASLRHSIRALYAREDFQSKYEFRVARVGDAWLPYWILRASDDVSTQAAASRLSE